MIHCTKNKGIKLPFHLLLIVFHMIYLSNLTNRHYWRCFKNSNYILIKDRTYSVKISNYISCYNMSLYRVPMGSTLCPILFTIYISPLKYIIEQPPNVKYIYMRMIFKFRLILSSCIYIYIKIYIYIYIYILNINLKCIEDTNVKYML